MCGSVGGVKGSCGKRYAGCGGSWGGCREVCWDVRGGKERCVESGKVWVGVWKKV